MTMLARAQLLLSIFLINNISGSYSFSINSNKINQQLHLSQHEPFTPNNKKGVSSSSLFMALGGGGVNAEEREKQKQLQESTILKSSSSEETIDSFLPSTSTAQIESLIVRPAQKVLDDLTGGWALSYANLSPETETTPIGIAFLASNLAYAVAGIMVSMQGDALLGTFTEMASVASFGYHYNQLKFSATDPSSPAVRLALLVDYTIAISAMSIGFVYLLLGYPEVPPMEVLASCGVALAFLGCSWIWEEGVSYIFFHSLWHLAGGYAGYLIGNLHVAQTMA